MLAALLFGELSYTQNIDCLKEAAVARVQATLSNLSKIE